MLRANAGGIFHVYARRQKKMDSHSPLPPPVELAEAQFEFTITGDHSK